MPSIIEKLGVTLPPSDGLWTKYVASPPQPPDPPSVQSCFLADQVCQLLAQGKRAELRPFFEALDVAYATAHSPADRLGLYEGFMENYVESLDTYQVPPQLAFDQLGEIARGVWRDAWKYCRGEAWLNAGA
jgi:hypothetical protein